MHSYSNVPKGDWVRTTYLSQNANCSLAGGFSEKGVGQVDSHLRDVGRCTHLLLYLYQKELWHDQMEADILIEYGPHIFNESKELADRQDWEALSDDEEQEFGIAVQPGLVFETEWTSDKAQLRMILDRCGLMHDEGMPIAYSFDWKFGWADPSADTIQSKCHVIGLAAKYPEAMLFNITVFNGRMFKPAFREYNWDDVTRFRQEIGAQIDAFFRQKKSGRKARIGAYCATCYYPEHCGDWKELVNDTSEWRGQKPEKVAKRYMAMTTTTADMKAHLEKVTKGDSGPIQLPGGIVGPYLSQKSEIASTTDLIKDWKQAGGKVEDMIEIASLGVTAGKKVVRQISKQNGKNYKELEEKHIRKIPVAKFGVKKQ